MSTLHDNEKIKRYDDEKKLAIDVKFKIINRFDFYINTTNTKAQIIFAVNTLIAAKIFDQKLEFKNMNHFECIWFFLIIIISGFITIITAIVIQPYLFHSQVKDHSKSVIFYGDIREKFEDYKDYSKFFEEVDIIDDLDRQIHSLSRIVFDKFRCLKYAVNGVAIEILFVLFYAMAKNYC